MKIKDDFLALFPENPRKLGLNPFLMRFDKNLEESYKKSIQENLLSKKRLALIVGVVMYLLFSVVDLILLPNIKGILWFIRLGFVVPLFLIVFASSYNWRIKPYVSKLILLLSLVLSISHLYSLTYFPPEQLSKFHLSYLAIVLYAFSLLSVDFLFSSINLFLMAISHTVLMILTNSLSLGEKIIAILLVFLSTLFGIAFLYYREYLKKRNFVLENKYSPFSMSIKRENKSNVKKQKDSRQRQIEKLEEEKLKEKEEAVLMAVEQTYLGMPEAMVFVSRDGEIKVSSPAVEEITGFSKEQLAGKNISDMIDSIDRKRFELSSEKNHQNQELLEEEFKIHASGGKSKFVKLKISSYVDLAYGEGYIIVIEGIQNTSTKQKKEAKLQIDPLGERGINLLSSSDEKDIYENLDKEELKLRLIETIKDSKTQIDAKLVENKKLMMKNKQLMADLTTSKNKLRKLAIQKASETDMKNVDDLKLTNMIASFYSNQVLKTLRANLKMVKDFEILLSKVETPQKIAVESFAKTSKSEILRSIYLSGAAGLRTALFERNALEFNSDRQERIEASHVLSLSISQMARFFEGTGYMVEVSCKDNIFISISEESMKLIIHNLVITSLYSLCQQENSGLIEIKVSEENSKVTIDYEYNGKPFERYYHEVLAMKKIDASMLSVNGIEFFLAKALIVRECGGDLQISQSTDKNKIRLTFFK